MKNNLRWDFFLWDPFQPQMVYNSTTLTYCYMHTWQLWHDPELQFWTCGNKQQCLAKVSFKEIHQDSYTHRIDVGKEVKIICQPSTATVIPESLKHITEHQVQKFLKHFRDRDSITSLGNLFQCLTTQTVTFLFSSI